MTIKLLKERNKNDLSSFFPFRPVQFDTFISSLLPEDLILTERERKGLTALAWALYGNSIPHHSGQEGLTPIHYSAKRVMFRFAARFSDINDRLGWFVEVIKGRPGLYASGWRLTELGYLVISCFFNTTLKRFTEYPNNFQSKLVDANGELLRLTKKGIRSTTKSGGKCRFPSWALSSQVKINGSALYKLCESATAFLSGDKLCEDSKHLTNVWQEYCSTYGDDKAKRRIRLAYNQAASLISMSSVNNTGELVLPTYYSESRAGRLYALGHINLQRCVREVRRQALIDNFDIDIENCHWTLFSQMARKVEVATPYIDYYVKNKHLVRKMVAVSADISIEDAKFVLISLIYGAVLNCRGARKSTFGKKNAIEQRLGSCVVAKLKKVPLVAGLVDDIKKAGDPIIDSYRERSRKAGFIVNDAGREISCKQRRAKILSHLLQGSESEILRVMIADLANNILILQHDGLTVSSTPCLEVLEQNIILETGYSCSLVLSML